MFKRRIFACILVIALGLAFLGPATESQAAAPAAPLQSSVTAYDLILATNTLRVSYGLPALIEDPIVNAVAQWTAEYMAANLLTWHIGDVRGRIAQAGYGAGATVWATENFAVGSNISIDFIMQVWSDADHMRPVVNPAYCHVGAGVATASNGQTYYVLQAAYTSEHACGDYYDPIGGIPTPLAGGGTPMPVSQWIVPVQIATPDAEGKIYHVVAAGQSFWSIAIAYKITIQDLEVWNNISRNTPLRVGQSLFIPSANTEGYATPTPVGMVVPSTPAPDGKIVHEVQPYNTLTTIAEAYDVTVDTLLALNGWQVDWPLSIGQTLLIAPSRVTPSPTPRPLTPLEKLTPAADGKYYHTVQSGETLTWIAGLYETTVDELMAWNWLTNASVIQPGQQLLLQVTPPPTPTYTLRPPTITPTQSPLPPSATFTPSATALLPTPSEAPGAQPLSPDAVLGIVIGLVVIGGGLTWWGWRTRKRGADE